MCAEIVFFSKCVKFLVGFKNSGCVSVFDTFCLVDFVRKDGFKLEGG